MNIKQLNDRVIKLLEELKITSEALNEGKKREVLSDEEYAKFLLSYMYNDPTYEELLNMLPMINDDLYLEEIKTIKRPKLKSLYKKAVELKKQTNESLDGDIVTVVDIPLVTEKLYNKLVNVLYGNKKDKNRDYEQQQNVLDFLQEIEDRIAIEAGISIDLEDYGFTEDEINAIKKIVRDERVDESLNEDLPVDKQKLKDLMFKYLDDIDCKAPNYYKKQLKVDKEHKDYIDVLTVEIAKDYLKGMDLQDPLQAQFDVEHVLTDNFEKWLNEYQAQFNESLNEAESIYSPRLILQAYKKEQEWYKSENAGEDEQLPQIMLFIIEDNKILDTKLIDRKDVYTYQPKENEYYLDRVRDSGDVLTDYNLEPAQKLVDRWNKSKQWESLKGYKEVAKIIKNDKGYNVAEKDEPMLNEDKSSLKSLLTELAKYL